VGRCSARLRLTITRRFFSTWSSRWRSRNSSSLDQPVTIRGCVSASTQTAYHRSRRHQDTKPTNISSCLGVFVICMPGPVQFSTSC
jgi:hypothetical protein